MTEKIIFSDTKDINQFLLQFEEIKYRQSSRLGATKVMLDLGSILWLRYRVIENTDSIWVFSISHVKRDIKLYFHRSKAQPKNLNIILLLFHFGITILI